ncbi:histidine kinase [Lentimicrobium sp. S6]|uniref:histidine kinase n=1 Tax=Lentimicrobium sp. S6 TaxID=2735872 RepID=UPI001554B7AD|nr:histidine kinase [Lentimicrobium sp. S6]NPD46775.1 histidine kinase [Lentimicrobium sp. S6]
MNKGYKNANGLKAAKNLEDNWYCNEDRLVLIDSLLNQYKNDAQMTEYLMIQKSTHFRFFSKHDESLKILDQALQNKIVFNKGLLLQLKAVSYIQDNQLAQAYDLLLLEQEVEENNTDTIRLIYNRVSLMNTLRNYRDLSFSSKYYFEALLLAESYGNNVALASVLRRFGHLNTIENPDFAGELFAKSWDIMRNEKSVQRIRGAISYLKFLVTHNNYEKFNIVFKEIEKELDESCFYNLAGTIFTLNAFKYSKLQQYDSSRIYNSLALESRLKGGVAQLIGASYLNLFQNALKINELDEAYECLSLSKSYLLQNKALSNKRYYLQYKLDYYTIVNNTDSIIDTQNQLIGLNEKFYKEQNASYVARINLEHNLKVKLERETFEIEIKSRKSKITYLIVISFLLVIIIIGLSYLFVNKSRRFNILKIRSKISFASIDEYKKEIKQLKNVFENAVTGFFILDRDFKTRYVNKRAESIFQSHEKQMASKPFSDMFLDIYHKEIEKGLEKVTMTLQNCELQVKHRINESDLVLNLSFSPMIINNELESILVIALDISSRVKALELEKKQRMILQTLFNSVTESIILLDGEGNIESINETAAKRLGKTVEELIGDNYFNQLPEIVKAGRIQKVRKSIQDKKAVIYDENIDSYNSLVSIYPSFDADGDVNYIAEFLQDITERRMAVEQINSLRQKVLRSQMNPHFVFNSLNAIQSYVLKNDAKKAVKYLNSFAKLIRMILDSSRFDYINLDKEIHILEYYLDLQQLRFGDKFDWSLNVDPKIDTDGTLIPAMLAQPFIENAIEHGLQHLEGSGTVKISFVRDKETIVFKVVDNGIGREESKKLDKGESRSAESLSTKLFKERLYTLNKYTERKITYDIIDLKDEQSKSKGTMVVINLPIIYNSNID